MGRRSKQDCSFSCSETADHFEQDYKKDDIEGRGEPAFSLGRDLHEHGHGEAIELNERPHGKSFDTRDPVEIAGGNQNYAALEEDRVHKARPVSPPHGHRFSAELKRRIGSLRGKKKEHD